MNLVLFTHPDFLGSQSMPRFAASLANAYRERGHRVELRSPRARLRAKVSTGLAAKWAGYVDQYLLFPLDIRAGLARDPEDTLYVFCDQALGPWVPYVAHRPHVVHCHDLLALRSALGVVPENPISVTGRAYQRYIRRGFRKARHFISVTAKTRDDLHRYGGVQPVISEVVHNGLNHPYQRMPAAEARAVLKGAGLQPPLGGMLLHVGSEVWYKNVPGVLRIYGQYLLKSQDPLPLWLIGTRRTPRIEEAFAAITKPAHVELHYDLDNIVLQAVYSLARALIFPSLAEGFGWPIIEAQACGCPVITTGDAPMNEIGGPAAIYLPRLQMADDLEAWAAHGADELQRLLAVNQEDGERLADTGMAWASRFDMDTAANRYLSFYQQVLDHERSRPSGGEGS
jgi:glycosyltransferase involved in cell wall biosynthesis